MVCDPTITAAGTDFCPDFGELLRAQGAHLEEYGRFQQHLGLLEDQKRVAAYLEAIAHTAAGAVVVDVGAGTGIWGLVALKCGFEHAFLIEPSKKMCEYARHLANINGLSHKITVIPSTLEGLKSEKIPAVIDLVVTETLSSVLFGFGSWDALPNLASRLSNVSSIIPIRGCLFGALTATNYALAHGARSGLGMLKSLGLLVDLSDRTFRSGGNVYDKGKVLQALRVGQLEAKCLASFDFGRPEAYSFVPASLPLAAGREYLGMILYWDVELTGGKSAVVLSSLDPELTSWYPLFVPFIEPIRSSEDTSVAMSLQLEARDHPYKYAFQFLANGRPITRLLYW